MLEPSEPSSGKRDTQRLEKIVSTWRQRLGLRRSIETWYRHAMEGAVDQLGATPRPPRRLSVGRICPCRGCPGCGADGCGDIFEGAPVSGRCPRCAPAHLVREKRRRAAKPQRKVWDSAAWQRLRRRIWRRDDWTCRRCGARDVGNRRRTLVCHHANEGGVAALLAAGADPLDPAVCETLCLPCSGQVDGARATSRSAAPAARARPLGSRCQRRHRGR